MAGRRKTDAPTLRWEWTPKRIRAVLGGAMAIDSTSVALVWEHDFYPQWFVPPADLAVHLAPSDATPAKPPPSHPVLGPPQYLDVTGQDRRTIPAGAWTHPDCKVPELADHVRFAWDTMPAWLEEDEPVFVHPRSPYVRIDALRASRQVRVEIDGTVVASSPRPTVLYETGLPPRFYLPISDVRLDLLERSDTSTACPYKGTANYYSVRIGSTLHRDVAFSYRLTTTESGPIAGQLCFWGDAVTVTVDGVQVEA